MGIGNIAAAASPSTHVSCEATKEHKVTVHHTTEKEDRIGMVDHIALFFVFFCVVLCIQNISDKLSIE